MRNSKVSSLASNARLIFTKRNDCVVEVERICADEERLLDTVQPNSQEAIISCMSMHWINDLPGVSCS
jgi:hypothetical protein